MKATSSGEKKLTKTQQAAAHLGIPTCKVGALVKEGAVEATVDPLDRHRHLILINSLDELKRRSLGKQ